MRNDPAARVRESSMSASLGTAAHELVRQRLEGEWTGEYSPPHAARRLAAMVPDADVTEHAWMVSGVLGSLGQYVRRVLAVESGFIARLGQHWIGGHIDLVYEPIKYPGTVAMADWKFGVSKPHAITLDHGWEAGLYGAALKLGVFEPHLGRDRYQLESDLIAQVQRAPAAPIVPTYGRFPSEIYQVHCHDYVPYARAGKREVSRPEDLARWGYVEPTVHKYAAGDVRGGAWMPVRFVEEDLGRLESRLRVVVGSARLGRFIDSPGGICTRCHYRSECLNWGHAMAANDEERAAFAALAREDRGV